MAILKTGGREYRIEKTVTIKNGTIYIDGEDISKVTGDVIINGDVKNLFLDKVKNISITGNVNNLSTISNESRNNK